ncbi:MAG: hypothetical protein V3V41_07950 [Candidatus Heimdallarchaeota archaeon]
MREDQCRYILDGIKCKDKGRDNGVKPLLCYQHALDMSMIMINDGYRKSIYEGSTIIYKDRF